ncbi:MAG TPA: ATP-binding protein [Lachnospiraceae bacterium]|nr:ATP-binding protein [Lachnospiraceae bacterium]
MKELEVKAEKEKLDEVLDFIHGILDETQCSMKTMMVIDLCVEEVFVNIASYAYGNEVGNAKVGVELDQDRSQVKLIFSDSGVPYDPLAKEDPDISLSVEERQIGGLGIFLVKKKMDDVIYEYKDGQNVLTLVKKLS